MDDVQVTEELSYEENPIAILDRQVRKLRTKDVAFIKVLWRNNDQEEMTWEAKEKIKNEHLYFFPMCIGNLNPSFDYIDWWMRLYVLAIKETSLKPL